MGLENLEREPITEYFRSVERAFHGIEARKILNLERKIEEIRDSGNTMYVIGNGGSSAAASHWACDLGKGTLSNCKDPNEKRLRVLSLSDNISTIAAYANDISYEEVFSQQLRNLIGKEDLLLAISASGESRNIIEAIKVAKEKESYVFGLLGNKGGEAHKLCDDSIIVPSKNYGVIEDIHSMIGHLVTEYLKGQANEMR